MYEIALMTTSSDYFGLPTCDVLLMLRERLVWKRHSYLTRLSIFETRHILWSLIGHLQRSLHGHPLSSLAPSLAACVLGWKGIAKLSIRVFLGVSDSEKPAVISACYVCLELFINKEGEDALVGE